MATRAKTKTKAAAVKKAASKKTAAKKVVAKKTAAEKAPAVAASRRFNLTYATRDADRKMIEGSARSRVHAFVAAAGAKGVDREGIEKQFETDKTVNVKASLDYLVKVGLMTTIPV